jgi:hypothetical protein
VIKPILISAAEEFAAEVAIEAGTDVDAIDSVVEADVGVDVGAV